MSGWVDLLIGQLANSSIQPKPLLCSPRVHAAYVFLCNEDGTWSQALSYTEYNILPIIHKSFSKLETSYLVETYVLKHVSMVKI